MRMVKVSVHHLRVAGFAHCMNEFAKSLDFYNIGMSYKS